MNRHEALLHGKGRAPSTFEQCTVEVESHLVCGCPTTINPFNSLALATIYQLKQKCQALQCATNVDRACAGCQAVTGSTCGVSSGGFGACTDLYS